MPIFNDFTKMKPRFTFKRCVNCGADVEYGMRCCCETNRNAVETRRYVKKKPIVPIVCLDPNSEGKYQLIERAAT